MLEIIHTTENLSSFLKADKRQKKHLFYDIETLTVNQSTKSPRELHPIEYIVSVSFIYKKKINYFFLPCISDLIRVFNSIETKAKIDLTGQNSFGYDNHFCLASLIELGYIPTNMERDSINVDYYKPKENEYNVQCLRVKRKSSLSMKFKINELTFETVDTFLKSNSKLETMAKKLFNLKLIDEEFLKLDDFDYHKYNKQEDMSHLELKKYAKDVFDSLNERQLQYCRNDVIILALYYYHYKEIYLGYDYSKMTLSQNIMNDYDTSPLAKLQLKNIFYAKDVSEMSFREKKKYECHIKYSDYSFNGVNLYNYIKATYGGGLVMYNEEYVGKIIEELLAYMDRNSSYPYTMYKFKYPTFLHSYGDKNKLSNMVNDDNYYSIFRMTIDDFNIMILDVKSNFMKCALVKYLYKGDDTITLNTNNLLLLQEFGVDLKQWNCIDYITFECVRFASYEKLSDFYGIKQQDKHKTLIDATDVENIIITDIPLDKLESTDEEVYLSKVSMNGVSGLPALRSTFPIYLLNENLELESHRTGFSNKERNCVFSAFTTSHSFYDLLHPLHTLTGEEIDKNVKYTDTDSLIVNESIRHKLDADFNHDNLGAWDIEHMVTKLYIANNKMYCFETDEGKVKVKSCGVRKDAFDTTLKFDEFVKKYLFVGCQLPNLKNVLTKYGTIALYDAFTEIKPPSRKLPNQIYKFTKEAIADIKRQVRESEEDFDDTIYIDSDFGSFSINDCFEPIHKDEEEKKDISKLISMYKIAKMFTL